MAGEGGREGAGLLRGAREREVYRRRIHEKPEAVVEAEVQGDARGSAAYKRELIRVFMGRAIQQAAGRVV